MDLIATVVLKAAFILALCRVSRPEPGPQYYPLPFGGQQQNAPPPPPQHHPWPHNLTNQLDPVSYPAAEEILKNDVPRQLYGAPPPYPGANNPPSPFQGAAPSPFPGANPSYPGAPTSFQGGAPSPYPQIYKLDNLIIIANPPQQACPPQRPPPDFPRPGPVDGLEDRFGAEQPSKCTWAIVACCSPGNNDVRYNCFELLGCPGFFFDNSPCDPKIVMEASRAALEFYSRGVTNTTNTGVDTNNV